MTILFVRKEVQLTIFICHIEFSFLLIIIFIPISLFGASNRFSSSSTAAVDALHDDMIFLWFYLYVKFTLTLFIVRRPNIGSWSVAIRGSFFGFWKTTNLFSKRLLRHFNFLRPKHRQTCIHFTNIHTHYYTSNFHNFCLL